MKFYTFVLVVTLGFPALACDVCGAVNSSLGLGTIALGNRHSFGLSYQYRSYKSTHPRFFSEPEKTSYEQFQRMDILGNIRISDRWQAKVTIPLVYNQQENDQGRSTKSGLGDPTATLNYFIIDRIDSTGSKQIRWSTGAGVKVPFGAFPEPHDPVLLLYPGTGSVDPVLQSVFLLRRNKWGFIQEMNGVYRFSNKYGYTPGSLVNASLFGFRALGDFAVFSGFQYAWNGIDYLDNVPLNSSPARGNLLTAAVGLTYKWNDLVVQANTHLPLVQQLGNSMVKQRQSFSISINYFLN